MGWMVWGLITGRGRDFSLQNVGIGSGAHLASCLVGTGFFVQCKVAEPLVEKDSEFETSYSSVFQRVLNFVFCCCMLFDLKKNCGKYYHLGRI
jgi:hypothetical protein